MMPRVACCRVGDEKSPRSAYGFPTFVPPRRVHRQCSGDKQTSLDLLLELPLGRLPVLHHGDLGGVVLPQGFPLVGRHLPPLEGSGHGEVEQPLPEAFFPAQGRLVEGHVGVHAAAVGVVDFTSPDEKDGVGGTGGVAESAVSYEASPE